MITKICFIRLRDDGSGTNRMVFCPKGGLFLPKASYFNSSTCFFSVLFVISTERIYERREISLCSPHAIRLLTKNSHRLFSIRLALDEPACRTGRQKRDKRKKEIQYCEESHFHSRRLTCGELGIKPSLIKQNPCNQVINTNQKGKCIIFS